MLMTLEMSRTVMELAKTGITKRHPDISEAELKMRLGAIMWGRSLWMVIWYDRAKVDCFVELPKNEFSVDQDMINAAIQHQGCFNLIHLGTMFEIAMSLF